MPGKAVVCSFPIKELTGGCDTVREDEPVPACQLLHLAWKEEIRYRNLIQQLFRTELGL